MSHRHVRAYADATLDSATPTQLLSALYKRLVRDIDDADATIASGDAGAKGTIINHAHAIVSELTTTLNHRVAPELCAQLAGLYAFVSRELVLANAKMSREHLAHAKKVVLTLQSGFEEAIVSLSSPTQVAAGASR